MIEGIELSKSNKALCKGCGKVIGEKSPRLVVDVDKGQYISHIYYCCDCSDKKIDEEIEYYKREIERKKKLKIELKKYIRENQKAIVLQKLERDKNEQRN